MSKVFAEGLFVPGKKRIRLLKNQKYLGFRGNLG